MSKKCVFTLMETLVILAIIGVLLSILIPSLSQSKEKTLVAFCLSNLKQLGQANYSFSSDNSGSLPIGLKDTINVGAFDTNVDPDGYETGLAPYFNYAVEVFECGFDKSNFQGDEDRRCVEDPNGNRHFAYRTYRPNNFRFTNLPTGGDGRWKNGLIKWNYSFNIGQISNDTILDGDYVRQVSYGNFGRPNYWDRRGASFGNHNNKSSNLIFIDGSANNFKVSSFLSNAGLLFGSTSTFDYENNSNNLGLFGANMTPIGAFWTITDD